MTQYFTDFSGSTPDAAPSGWTAQWYNTGSWLYRAGGYVEIDQSAYGNSLLLWTDLGSLTDCEILVKLRLVDNTSSDQFLFGAVARANATRAYRGGVQQSSFFIVASGIEQDTGNDAAFGIGSPTDGALSSVPTGTDYWVRLQVIGTAFKFKAWEDGAGEPGWAIEAAAPVNYADGYVGIYSHHRDATKYIYQVGVTDSPATESAPSEGPGDAFPPAGGLTITAIPPNVGPIPAGDLEITALAPSTGVFAYPPAPDLQITALAPNIETLTFAPVGALAITAQVPFLSVTPPADAVRVYRVKITIAGETTYAVPVNWQARYAIDRSNYLSVTLHAPEQSLIDLLNGAVGSSPAETVTLVIQGGYRWPDGSAYYRDMITSEMQDVTTGTGPRSSSTLLSGYLSADAGVVKAVTLPSAITIRSGTVATTWVGPINIDLAPGDQVTVSDTGATFVVGNITYRVDARNATMDVSELTDADVLATLPW